MEKNRFQRVLRTLVLILAVLCAVFLGIHLTLSLMAPARTFKNLANYYISSIPDSTDVLIPDSLIGYEAERAYLNGLIELAAYDSVSLSINLCDTTANLRYKGVELQKINFSSLNSPAILESLTDQMVIKIFSQPLRIVYAEASIEHEPIVVKKAPKDTIEAALMNTMPDTVNRDAVAFYFLLENGLQLTFIQDSLKDEMELGIINSFKNRKKLKHLTSAFNSVIHLKIPDYNPEILFHLPEEDAKTLYRALPPRGLIFIKPATGIRNE